MAWERAQEALAAAAAKKEARLEGPKAARLEGPKAEALAEARAAEARATGGWAVAAREEATAATAGEV